VTPGLTLATGLEICCASLLTLAQRVKGLACASRNLFTEERRFQIAGSQMCYDTMLSFVFYRLRARMTHATRHTFFGMLKSPPDSGAFPINDSLPMASWVADELLILK
jgi:hypothetical protein